MRSHPLVTMVLFACLTACGGGGDVHLIASVDIDSTSKQAMAGDWPIARYNVYIVQDQPNWDAVWAERLQGIDCTRQFNSAACASSDPPAIDFSQFLLVGLYLDHYGQFVDLPNSLLIFEDETGLVIEFSLTFQTTPITPITTPPVSSFFLVPKSGKYVFPRITVRPRSNET